jgi:hypothetical protein
VGAIISGLTTQTAAIEIDVQRPAGHRFPMEIGVSLKVFLTLKLLAIYIENVGDVH